MRLPILTCKTLNSDITLWLGLGIAWETFYVTVKVVCDDCIMITTAEVLRSMLLMTAVNDGPLARSTNVVSRPNYEDFTERQDIKRNTPSQH